MSEMYEPLRLVVSDHYPSVVPREGAMAFLVMGSMLWALTWLLYRAYLVFQTPNDMLVEKLGLDIPPIPELTLEEIGAQWIRVAWKHPDLQHSIRKYSIQINGVKVGETKRSETAVAISNLAPNHIYHVCVIAVSAANFQTSSSVLHVRTINNVSPQAQEDDIDCGPVIQAYVPKPSSAIVPSVIPSISREHSGGQILSKRTSAGRRPTAPSVTSSEYVPADADSKAAEDESEEVIRQLSERLKALQQENDAIETQLSQEDKEHETFSRELEEQRNKLKQRVREKDEARGDLRKRVNTLENTNRTVQNERSKRERLLQQREVEKRKRQEDIARWTNQLASIEKDSTKIRDDNIKLKTDTETKLSEIRAKISREQSEMKSLDDEIKAKKSRIKQMEEERRRLEGDDGDDNHELDRLERERDRYWEIKLGNLRAQYSTLISAHIQAQQQYNEAQSHLEWIVSQRSSAPLSFPHLPSLDIDIAQRNIIQRRNRHRGSLASNMSSPVSFPLVDPSTFNYAGNSPTVSGPSFFNAGSGMIIPDMTETKPKPDVGTQLNNFLMSPRADDLLPSDLLGDEEQTYLKQSPPRHPAVANLSSGLGLDNVPPSSPSPVSSGSQPASAFASPGESMHNVDDGDSRFSQKHDSLSQVPEEASHGTSKRFSGLFNFHRQRGKTLDDGILFGTLKQSQSFPRDSDEPGMAEPKRRHTGWANPMGLFPRNNTSEVTPDSSSDHQFIAGRRSSMFPGFFSSGRVDSIGLSHPVREQSDVGYNQFSPRHDPIDPSILGNVRCEPASPRPSSHYSFDNILRQPGGDNFQSFGWPSIDKTCPRVHPLGVDWSSTSWSRSPSRRPSFKLGSTGHLPIGLPPDVELLEPSFEIPRPVQAPIGTRPLSSHRPVTPKLNPAAPSFRTIFGKKTDKGKEKEPEFVTEPDPILDQSPSEPRQSRDSQSVSTTESYESLERISSGTPSEQGNIKGSLIQKLTRKGGSGKFSVPWKDRSSRHKRTESTEGESAESQLSRSIDSVGSGTPSLDKSNKSSGFFRRKNRKSKDTSSSVASASAASETGDGETGDDGPLEDI